MKYEYDTATPYVASYVILRQAGKIAFLLRSKGWMSDHYGLPSGKKEKGESPTQAGVREAEEEVGVIIKPENMTHLLTMSRYESDSDQEWEDHFFEASTWQGEIKNAEPESHAEVVPFTPNDLPGNIVPCVRFALTAIEAGESYTEYGWS
jgi:8-oxo-dGTP pyrophosphatase MutT (NUDIX family)